MNPSFLPTNSWSSSLITKRHSDSLCCQLGCIWLCAAQLMFQMIMPCFIIAVTRLCFVNIAHNRCAYLHTCCLILSCTVSICLSLVCSGLKYSPVVLFLFAKRIQSYYYYFQLSGINVTMSTLILSIFFVMVNKPLQDFIWKSSDGELNSFGFWLQSLKTITESRRVIWVSCIASLKIIYCILHPLPQQLSKFSFHFVNGSEPSGYSIICSSASQLLLQEIIFFMILLSFFFPSYLILNLIQKSN